MIVGTRTGIFVRDAYEVGCAYSSDKSELYVAYNYNANWGYYDYNNFELVSKRNGLIVLCLLPFPTLRKRSAVQTIILKNSYRMENFSVSDARKVHRDDVFLEFQIATEVDENANLLPAYDG